MGVTPITRTYSTYETSLKNRYFMNKDVNKHGKKYRGYTQKCGEGMGKNARRGTSKLKKYN